MPPVYTVNGNAPDIHGNVNVSKSLTYVNDPTKELKIFTGIATVTGNSGVWELDYTTANFNTVVDVNPKLFADSFPAADAPLATNITSFTNKKVIGKAFKATSAGLLAAMQQTPAESGTRVLVSVIGY